MKSAQPADASGADRCEVHDTVAGVLADVRVRGDAAVREYSERFDHWSPAEFRVSEEEVERIVATVPEQVIEDIRFVQAQVRNFAEHQRASIQDFEIETMPGVLLGQLNIPVAAAGEARL